MSAELVIRASWGDHQVIGDLLAPGGGSVVVGRRRPIIGRLVADAAVAAKRPQLAEAAEGAGVPFLIDPVTTLIHGELREEDPWVRYTTFGRAESLTPDRLRERALRDAFVAEVVDFQVEHGATAVIPPYPYVSSVDDEWFEIALEWVVATRRYMESQGIGLPLFPILCGQLQKLGNKSTWSDGLDRFAAFAANSGAQSLGLCLSPVGDGHDSYQKLLRLFQATEHMREASGLPVLAWRQGIYGPALVAAGIDGYETGMGTSEQANVRANIAARKPPPEGQASTGRSFSGIYFEPFGRSVSKRVAQLLLANVSMRAKIMCTDERCCPHGIASTLDESRPHAVRSRARELTTLAALPARAWRLNHLSMKAQGAHTLGTQANRVLADVGETYRIHTKGYESLRRVTEELREADSEGQVVA